MKDFIQFTALMVVILGLLAAIPVIGIVVGTGVGTWFLWKGWQEERDANRD